MTTINDREWAFLAELTGDSGPFNDMYFKYLRSLGYTGTLQDMIAAYGGGLIPSQGVSYDPDAIALFDRFTIKPNDARKVRINNLITTLKDLGVWSKLDALWIFTNIGDQPSLQNWIADQYNATAVGSPVFTVDRGFQTNGTSSYIETNFNPSTAVGAKFTASEGSMGFWSRTAGQAGVVDMGQTFTLLTARNSSDQCAHRINWSISGGTASANGSGHFVTSRTGPLNTDTKLYRNGGLLLGSVSAGTTQALENATIQIGKRGNAATYSARQFAAAHIGGGLTAQNVTDLYNALNTYMIAVGAV